jgi:hypothetical protein
MIEESKPVKNRNLSRLRANLSRQILSRERTGLIVKSWGHSRRAYSDPNFCIYVPETPSR